jgi:hypothetical protein
MSIHEYPFPSKIELENRNYRVFPTELEDDSLVLFHGTLARNFDSIQSNGFKSASALGIGTLESVSFAYKSDVALTHIANLNGARIIIAVRYETLDNPKIRKNNVDIHDYALAPPPALIGVCRMPLEYKHI